MCVSAKEISYYTVMIYKQVSEEGCFHFVQLLVYTHCSDRNDVFIVFSFRSYITSATTKRHYPSP